MKASGSIPGAADAISRETSALNSRGVQNPLSKVQLTVPASQGVVPSFAYNGPVVTNTIDEGSVTPKNYESKIKKVHGFGRSDSRFAKQGVSKGYVPSFAASSSFQRKPMPVPKFLDEMSQKIQEIGGSLQIVGGAPRDFIMGKSPKDWDVEVFGLTQNKLEEFLSKNTTIAKKQSKIEGQKGEGSSLIGKDFGVFKTKHDGQEYEFSMPRKEEKTGAGHKGFDVEFDPFMSKLDAAKRRDLTINSISYDPLNKKFIDPLGGIKDLENKVMKPTSSRFKEDPLRVLRAMQFAGRYDLKADKKLIEYAKSMTGEFKSLPTQRVRDEWMKWASKSEKPSAGLEFLKQSGWIKHFPEIDNLQGVPQSKTYHPEGDVFEHTKLVTDAVAKNPKWREMDSKSRAETMFSALGHDFGKPTHTQIQPDGKITSKGHAAAGAKPFEKFLSRILPEGEAAKWAKKLKPIQRDHMLHSQKDFGDNKMSDKSLNRLVNRVTAGGANMDQFLVQLEGDMQRHMSSEIITRKFTDKDALNIDSLREKINKRNLTSGPPKDLVQGRDLIKEGLASPGPEMGRILKELREAQLDNKFKTTQDGIDYFKNNKSNILKSSEGLTPNFAGFGGKLLNASKMAASFGLPKMPKKNDLFMDASASDSIAKIAKVSHKEGLIYLNDGQEIRMDSLGHSRYQNKNLFRPVTNNPSSMVREIQKSGKAMIRDGRLEAGLLSHPEGSGYRLQKVGDQWTYGAMGKPSAADSRILSDVEVSLGREIKGGLEQTSQRDTRGFVDWGSNRPGYLSEGNIPNFVQYRQHAKKDIWGKKPNKYGFKADEGKGSYSGDDIKEIKKQGYHFGKKDINDTQPRWFYAGRDKDGDLLGPILEKQELQQRKSRSNLIQGKKAWMHPASGKIFAGDDHATIAQDNKLFRGKGEDGAGSVKDYIRIQKMEGEALGQNSIHIDRMGHELGPKSFKRLEEVAISQGYKLIDDAPRGERVLFDPASGFSDGLIPNFAPASAFKLWSPITIPHSFDQTAKFLQAWKKSGKNIKDLEINESTGRISAIVRAPLSSFIGSNKMLSGQRGKNLDFDERIKGEGVDVEMDFLPAKDLFSEAVSYKSAMEFQPKTGAATGGKSSQESGGRFEEGNFRSSEHLISTVKKGNTAYDLALNVAGKHVKPLLRGETPSDFLPKKAEGTRRNMSRIIKERLGKLSAEEINNFSEKGWNLPIEAKNLAMDPEGGRNPFKPWSDETKNIISKKMGRMPGPETKDFANHISNAINEIKSKIGGTSFPTINKKWKSEHDGSDAAQFLFKSQTNREPSQVGIVNKKEILESSLEKFTKESSLPVEHRSAFKEKMSEVILKAAEKDHALTLEGVKERPGIITKKV